MARNDRHSSRHRHCLLRDTRKVRKNRIDVPWRFFQHVLIPVAPLWEVASFWMNTTRALSNFLKRSTHMSFRRFVLTTGLVAASLASAHSYAALQGRDLDGNQSTFEAYYDTALDLTWLADANYAKTQYINSGGTLGDSDGRMSWDRAVAWADSLSFAHPLTGSAIDGWRLPTATDTGAPGEQCAFVGTDCGYNVDVASSEMAHLYFATLGNHSYYTSTGAGSGAFTGGANPNSTLDNVGPFTDFGIFSYWYGTALARDPSRAWVLDIHYGYQIYNAKTAEFYAMAVHPGDVAAVPEAQTYALMMAGLGLMAWRVRRSR